MTKDKHTPAPWRLFSKGRTVAIGQGDGSHAEDRVVHWSGFDACGVSLSQQKANARLMSAAPEMLAALRIAKAYLTANFGDECAETEEIDAALKKATGSTRV